MDLKHIARLVASLTEAVKEGYIQEWLDDMVTIEDEEQDYYSQLEEAAHKLEMALIAVKMVIR